MKKKWKRVKESFSSFMNRYVNGTKGAISLFLVFTFAPLMSIALLLVEGVRYQHTQTLVQEMIDSSAFSTLGYMDEYLDDRFGLLSINQEKPVDDAFSYYFTQNKKAFGDSVDFQDPTASGELPLSDKKIFKEQIAEYSEYTVPAEIIGNGLNIGEIFSALAKDTKVEKLTKFTDAAGKTADATKIVVEILDILKNSISTIQAYDNAKKTYAEKYTALKDKIIETSDKIEEKDGETITETDEADSKFTDSTIINLVKETKTAASEYKTAAGDFSTKMDDVGTKITSLVDKIFSLPKEFNGVKDKWKKFKEHGVTPAPTQAATPAPTATEGDDGTTGETEQESTYKVVIDLLTKVYDVIDPVLSAGYKQVVATDKEKITTQKNALERFITGTKVKLGLMTTTDPQVKAVFLTKDWDETRVKNLYANIESQAFGAAILTAFTGAVASIDAVQETAEHNEFLKEMLDFADKIMQMGLLYDSSFNAQISAEFAPANPAVTDDLSITSVQALISSIGNFKDAVLNVNIIAALKALIDLLAAIVTFVGALIAWVAKVLWNLGTFIASGIVEAFQGGGIGAGMRHQYETILLYGYSVYNMPNRVNARDGKTITGHKYSDISTLAGGIPAKPNVVGDLLNFNASSMSKAHGGSPMFKGAIAEYMLTGFPGEIANQTATFINLFFFRMFVNAIPVFTDKWIGSILTVAGPIGWAIKLAILLLESLIDVVILVNGGDIPFVKFKQIFLSPAGMLDLGPRIANLKFMPESTKTSINKSVSDTKAKQPKVTATTGDKVKGAINEIDYTDSLLLLMVCSVSRDNMINRLQNVVQMEGKTYHATSAAGGFDLTKANTHVKTEITYDLNTFFKFDGLSDSYKKTVTAYSGY